MDRTRFIPFGPGLEPKSESVGSSRAAGARRAADLVASSPDGDGRDQAATTVEASSEPNLPGTVQAATPARVPRTSGKPVPQQPSRSAAGHVAFEPPPQRASVAPSLPNGVAGRRADMPTDLPSPTPPAATLMPRTPLRAAAACRAVLGNHLCPILLQAPQTLAQTQCCGNFFDAQALQAWVAGGDDGGVDCPCCRAPLLEGAIEPIASHLPSILRHLQGIQEAEGAANQTRRNEARADVRFHAGLEQALGPHLGLPAYVGNDLLAQIYFWLSRCAAAERAPHLPSDPALLAFLLELNAAIQGRDGSAAGEARLKPGNFTGIRSGHRADHQAYATWVDHLPFGPNPALKEHISLLLSREVDATDPEGRTALHLAAAADNLALCNALLNAGLSPQTRDNDGRSPLQLVAAAGGDDAIALLLAASTHTDPTLFLQDIHAVLTDRPKGTNTGGAESSHAQNAFQKQLRCWLALQRTAPLEHWLQEAVVANQIPFVRICLETNPPALIDLPNLCSRLLAKAQSPHMGRLLLDVGADGMQALSALLLQPESDAESSLLKRALALVQAGVSLTDPTNPGSNLMLDTARALLAYWRSPGAGMLKAGSICRRLQRLTNASASMLQSRGKQPSLQVLMKCVAECHAILEIQTDGELQFATNVDTATVVSDVIRRCQTDADARKHGLAGEGRDGQAQYHDWRLLADWLQEERFERLLQDAAPLSYDALRQLCWQGLTANDLRLRCIAAACLTRLAPNEEARVTANDLPDLLDAVAGVLDLGTGAYGLAADALHWMANSIVGALEEGSPAATTVRLTSLQPVFRAATTGIAQANPTALSYRRDAARLGDAALRLVGAVRRADGPLSKRAGRVWEDHLLARSEHAAPEQDDSILHAAIDYLSHALAASAVDAHQQPQWPAQQGHQAHQEQREQQEQPQRHGALPFVRMLSTIASRSKAHGRALVAAGAAGLSLQLLTHPAAGMGLEGHRLFERTVKLARGDVNARRRWQMQVQPVLAVQPRTLHRLREALPQARSNRVLLEAPGILQALLGHAATHPRAVTAMLRWYLRGRRGEARRRRRQLLADQGGAARLGILLMHRQPVVRERTLQIVARLPTPSVLP